MSAGAVVVGAHANGLGIIWSLGPRTGPGADSEWYPKYAVAAARANAEAIAAEAARVGRERAHAEIAALLATARAESAAVAERALDLIITATRAVAERAIGSAVAIDDSALTGWAREALAT